jgi:chemotaxis protein methyltransferase CheR
MKDLEPISELIKERSGLCLPEDRRDVLRRAVRTRMDIHALGSAAQYYFLLQRDHDEIYALVNHLTVNETYFLREFDVLDLFARRLFPELKSRADKRGLAGGDRRVRMFCAGCSTGEEAYSVLLVLLDRYGPEVLDKVSLVGADIDGDAIQTCINGVYGPHSFRGVGAHWISTYFRQGEGRLRELRPDIREAVEFVKFNLRTHEYPKGLTGMDVIFYRNVSIYFDQENQRAIFTRLADALNPGGFLVLGAAETLYHDIQILPLMEIEGSFIFRKPLPGEPGPVAPALRSRPSALPAPEALDQTRIAAERRRQSPPPPPPPEPAQAAARPTCSSDGPRGDMLESIVALAREKSYDRALDALDAHLSAGSADLQALAIKAAVLINLSRVAEAREVCEQILAADQWHMEATLLKGMAARLEGRPTVARENFKRAVYIDPQCWMAHFQLAEQCRLAGENALAVREYATAERLLRLRGVRSHGLTYFPFSYSTEQIVNLCAHYMQALGRPGEAPGA